MQRKASVVPEVTSHDRKLDDNARLIEEEEVEVGNVCSPEAPEIGWILLTVFKNMLFALFRYPFCLNYFYHSNQCIYSDSEQVDGLLDIHLVSPLPVFTRMGL